MLLPEQVETTDLTSEVIISTPTLIKTIWPNL